MSPGYLVLYLCAGGGLLLVVGCLWLLFSQRVVLDKETGQVTQVELPMGFKLATNVPIVILFFLGGFLLVYAAQEVRNFGEEVSVDGDVAGTKSDVQLYASVASQSLPGSGPFTLPLPVTHPQRKYMLIFTMNGKVIFHTLVDPAKAKQHLAPLDITPPEDQDATLVGDVQPVPTGY